MGKYWNKQEEIEYLPDIEDYLESLDHSVPVTTKGLEEIVDNISARTNLNPEQAKVVTRLFFQEIRNSILRGKTVIVRKLGSFFIINNKEIYSPRFRLSRHFRKELNDKK